MAESVDDTSERQHGSETPERQCIQFDMTSKALLKGLEVDVNRLIDAFAERVQAGAPLRFGTFKEVWKGLHMSFLLVCAPSEDEIAAHIQDLFMCVLDRFELPSPLKYGQHFGDLHKPRLRRPDSTEKQSLLSEASIPAGSERRVTERMEGGEGALKFCDAFKEAPDFPKAELQEFVSFPERVAVIYALYCIYKEQCLKPRVCIHVPVDMLPLFVGFLPRLKSENVLDALHIFRELWQQNAFVFDALRRPPGFLSLPLETSPSEATALRELSFHLKTSLQDLSRTDKLESMCDAYAELQQQWTGADLAPTLTAKSLVVFNPDVGKWLKSVTTQEHQQVRQGITGLSTKQTSSSKKQPVRKSKRTASLASRFASRAGREPSTAVTGKRKWWQALPKVTLTGDDSWGIATPGLPRMAQLVMMRDKQRRKEAEKVAQPSIHRTDPAILSRELRSEDFYNACSDMRAPPSRAAQTEAGADAVSEEASPRASSGERPVLEGKDSEASAEVEAESSEDDEMRKWKQELSVLNEEISQTHNSLRTP